LRRQLSTNPLDGFRIERQIEHGIQMDIEHGLHLAGSWLRQTYNAKGKLRLLSQAPHGRQTVSVHLGVDEYKLRSHLIDRALSAALFKNG